jgi:uncharacterized protein (TIGR00251 family)
MPMADGYLPYKRTEGGILLRLKVIPGAGRNSMAEVRNGELLVRIQAPARKGAANKELVKYLARSLSLPRSEIAVVTGATSRHKVIRLPLRAETALRELPAGGFLDQHER